MIARGTTERGEQETWKEYLTPKNHACSAVDGELTESTAACGGRLRGRRSRVARTAPPRDGCFGEGRVGR
jgi:hypothetical protein